MDSIFRREALEAQRNSWIGTIQISTAPAIRALALFSLVIVAGLVCFVCLAHYTRRQQVEGFLAPDAGLLELTAPASATVAEVRIAQGALVTKNQPLVRLSADRASETLGRTAGAIREQLALQLAKLRSDIADQPLIESEKQHGLSDKESGLRAQLAQVQSQLAIQHHQVENHHSTFQRLKPLLDKGYVSAIQVEQEHSSELDASLQVLTLERQRSELSDQIKATRNELTLLPLTSASAVRDLERKAADLEQSLAKNALDQADVIEAPDAGEIASVLVQVGQSVQQGQVLATLMPKDSKLEAMLLVPSRSIGFVKAGDAVALRYQAFPYQKFGIQSGTVRVVSRNPMPPAQITALYGLHVEESLFRVEAAIDVQSIRAGTSSEMLRPGMVLEADIRLDRRRIIEWLFEPLFGAKSTILEGSR